jgi:hypothetical protein
VSFKSYARQAAAEVDDAIACLQRATDIVKAEDCPGVPLTDRQSRCLSKLIAQRTALADLAREILVSNKDPLE